MCDFRTEHEPHLDLLMSGDPHCFNAACLSHTGLGLQASGVQKMKGRCGHNATCYSEKMKYDLRNQL